jgi:hypothetical protein
VLLNSSFRTSLNDESCGTWTNATTRHRETPNPVDLVGITFVAIHAHSSAQLGSMCIESGLIWGWHGLNQKLRTNTHRPYNILLTILARYLVWDFKPGPSYSFLNCSAATCLVISRK